MNPDLERLASAPNIAHLATLMPDGSPQATPVWVDCQGGLLLVNTASGRAKHKNVQRDPRVALSITSAGDPLDTASARGTVAEIKGDPEYAHADALAKKYMGLESYPFRRPGEQRIILCIRPERVFVMPKLPDGS